MVINMNTDFTKSLFAKKQDSDTIAVDAKRVNVAHLCEFEKLEKKSDTDYFITKPRQFKAEKALRSSTIESAFNFAFEMSFGGSGQHRGHRSGGSHHRKNGEIFANAFQGKLAEFAVYNLLHKGNEINAPDLDTYGLGEWDNVDIIVNGHPISVKSTKHYGHLLLLETSDWDNEGMYIPNKGTGHETYDYFILVRFEPDCESLLKSKRLLLNDHCSKAELEQLIMRKNWLHDIAGYISHEDLKEVIKGRHIIPKRAMLNGKTPMDAENYYIQAGDMGSGEDLKNELNTKR